MSDEKIEISESSLTKIAGLLTTVAPIGLGVLQYVNDPDNFVGLLICALLFVVLVLWRQTQATVRKLEAEILILRNLLMDRDDLYSRYKALSNNTIVNMFAQISRLSGFRDAGSTSVDPATGATVYVAPVGPQDSPFRRATDPGNVGLSG